MREISWGFNEVNKKYSSFIENIYVKVIYIYSFVCCETCPVHPGVIFLHFLFKNGVWLWDSHCTVTLLPYSFIAEHIRKVIKEKKKTSILISRTLIPAFIMNWNTDFANAIKRKHWCMFVFAKNALCHNFFCISL